MINFVCYYKILEITMELNKKDNDFSNSENNLIYENLSLELKEKLQNVPSKPGIYQFFNENNKIIYIGKAKNLRNRIRSYFQKARYVDAKTKAMIDKIYNFETIVVDSEAEAFILEDTLIKKYKPKYNIMLRDDKSYPYIRITNEEFPRIFKTRKIIRDGSKYFGPYTDVGHLKRLLKFMRQLLQFRTCNLNLNSEDISKGKFKECLDYHIKICEAPCIGLISKELYNQRIKQAIQVLNGKTKEIENALFEEMEKYAENLQFEEAGRIRDKLKLLQNFSEHQKIISNDFVDRDVIGFAISDKTACTLIFKIRDGKLIGKRHYIIPDTKNLSEAEIMQYTVEKWYRETTYIPQELFLPVEIEQPEFIINWLNQVYNISPKIIVPKLGEKRKLVNLANANAEYLLKEYLLAFAKREQIIPKPVHSLQRDLRLNKPPRLIECFDNSHIQGSDLVSAVVVFRDGKPVKSEYRRFIIKTVTKNDDFSAIKEAVFRRYKRILEEKKELPDLVIIDGGKGQLSSAITAFNELDITKNINIIAIAKRLDEIFVPNKSEPILLPKTSSSLKLIQHIRDEAHKTAITFHRKRRDKRTFQTELTEIKGIGSKTAEKLIKHFGSVEEVKKANFEDIAKITSKRVAQSLFDYFKIEKTNS